jgi:hypothetical protein
MILTCHPTPHISWDTTTVSTIGFTITVGPAKAQGLKVKLICWVRAAQSNQSEGRSDTKEGQYFGTPSAPSWGPGLLKLRI